MSSFTNSLDVNGKSVIITGACSGFGFALAKRLADQGANVVAADINEKLPAVSKGKVVYFKADVSIQKEQEALFAFAKKTFGSIDIVVNNAGVFEPTWSMFWSPIEKFNTKQIDINLSGIVIGTRLAVYYMMRNTKPGGIIINTASLAGFTPLFPNPIYASTKHGIVGFTRSFGYLENVGIRVVGIAPTSVETPIWSRENLDRYQDKMPFASVDQIVDSMENAIRDPAVPGGSIMLIMHDKTSLVENLTPAIDFGGDAILADLKSLKI